jgi:uncharacterized membrane protein
MRLKVKEPLKWHWNKVINYFIQGILILAPIIITAWAVISLFLYVDNILPSIIQKLFPFYYNLQPDGSVEKIPGVGFVVIIFLIVLVGWFSTSFFVGKMVDFFGHLLERTPGVKFIYTSVKDFLEAFAGEKRKFDKPVLVNVDAENVWRIGFMTQETGVRLGMEEHVVVYIPHSYAVSGVVYIVPAEKVRILHDMTPAEAMKFLLSGGVAEITH